MKKKFKITIALILGMCFAFFVFKPFISNSTDPEELSLKEAYELSLQEAKKWNSKSKLYSITSTNNRKKDSEISGNNGKRSNWNSIYAVPDTNKWMIIYIRDGRIRKTEEVNQFKPKRNQLIDFNDVLIDSSQALKKAKDNYNLKHGEGWAMGYHFSLYKSDNIPIISVVGLDDKGYFSKVFINATTGEIISGNHKIPVGGGFYELNSKISLINNRHYAIVGGTISPNFANDKSIIIWGYSDPSTPYSKPVIEFTHDEGVNWKDLNVNDNITEVFFSDKYKEDNIIYLVTENNIFKTKTSMNKLDKLFSIKQSIIDADKQGKYFGILTEKELNISDDHGYSWSASQIPQNTKAVEINSKNEIFILTDEAILKKDIDKWSKIEIPFENILLGLEISNDSLITYTDKRIGILNQDNKTWEVIEHSKNIRKVYLDFNFDNNHQLYVLSKDGTITKLVSDESGWKGVKIDDPNQYGRVANIISGPFNKLYFCKTPNLQWEEIKRVK